MVYNIITCLNVLCFISLLAVAPVSLKLWPKVTLNPRPNFHHMAPGVSQSDHNTVLVDSNNKFASSNRQNTINVYKYNVAHSNNKISFDNTSANDGSREYKAPAAKDFEVPDFIITVRENERTSIYCESVGSRPASVFIWTEDGNITDEGVTTSIIQEAHSGGGDLVHESVEDNRINSRYMRSSLTLKNNFNDNSLSHSFSSKHSLVNQRSKEGRYVVRTGDTRRDFSNLPRSIPSKNTSQLLNNIQDTRRLLGISPSRNAPRESNSKLLRVPDIPLGSVSLSTREFTPTLKHHKSRLGCKSFSPTLPEEALQKTAVLNVLCEWVILVRVKFNIMCLNILEYKKEIVMIYIFNYKCFSFILYSQL